jgi:hypothetical protein
MRQGLPDFEGKPRKSLIASFIVRKAQAYNDRGERDPDRCPANRANLTLPLFRRWFRLSPSRLRNLVAGAGAGHFPRLNPSSPHPLDPEDRMQATDLFAALLSAMHSERPILPALADFPRPATEQAAPVWVLDTPPLRYDVASLEHWLDLNA